MNDRDFEDLFEVEQKMWWFQGMRSITSVVMEPVWRDFDSPDILDAGCGTGDMLQWLSTHSPHVTGLDVSVTALDFCRKRGHQNLVHGSATDLPFGEASFDVVTSFDVLVQLPALSDVSRAMREMHRVLRPGGWAFVRAAAYPWMRGSHDVTLASNHRFTRSAMKDLATDAGFRVNRSGYANSFLLPVAMMHRLALQPLGLTAGGSDVRPLPPSLDWLNGPFRTLLQWEAAIMEKGPSLPFGLSVFTLLRKPG
jgi:SAM-dependent methyltransferase